MSVFTSRVTRVVSIPHDEGQSVTIRKLNPTQLERARSAQKAAVAEDLKRELEVARAVGGADFLKELRDVTPASVESATSADPLLLFDRVTLARLGVVAWTYAPEVRLTPEAVEDLDEPTLDLVAREVLRLAKPELFQSSDEAREARKNA